MTRTDEFADRDLLLRQTIETRLSEQLSSVNTFNTRAGLVLATSGVIFAGYAQLLTEDMWLLSCWSLLFIPEILLVAVSGYFAFDALALGGEKESWFHDPDPEKYYRLSREKNLTELEDEGIRSMIQAYNDNKNLFTRKYRILNYARYALYGSGAVFMIHLFGFFFI